jgi:hypothetical protein
VVVSAQDRADHYCHYEPVEQERDLSSVSTSLTCNIISLMCPKMFSASLLLPDSLEFARIFDDLGPTPRLCFELSELEQLGVYEEDVEHAISNITADQLERLIREAASLTTNSISHKICLISRERRDDVHSIGVVSPITHSIQSRIANRLRNLEQADLIRLYKYFAMAPQWRATAGFFFEAAAQRRLQDGTNLELLPMVQLTTSRNRSLPWWYSSHSPLCNASLEESRQHALQQRLVITVRPSRTVEYPDAGLSLIAPGIFYVPEPANKVALNSFIMADGFLYIFQFTIASVHDTKRLDFLEKCQGIPPMDNWRFVFVIPPDLALTTPQPSLFKLRKLRPHSSVILLED